MTRQYSTVLVLGLYSTGTYWICLSLNAFYFASVDVHVSYLENTVKTAIYWKEQ